MECMEMILRLAKSRDIDLSSAIIGAFSTDVNDYRYITWLQELFE